MTDEATIQRLSHFTYDDHVGATIQMLPATRLGRYPIVAKSQVSSDSIPCNAEAFVRLFGSISDITVRPTSLQPDAAPMHIKTIGGVLKSRYLTAPSHGPLALNRSP